MAQGDRRTAPSRIALCLHEDYDAQGCYVYEMTQQPGAVGPEGAAGLRDRSFRPTCGKKSTDAA